MGDRLSEIADQHLGLLGEDSATPVEDTATEEAAAPPKETEGQPDDHAQATPDINSVLTELKGRVERGELKIEDLPPEILPADARKVQSSFAKKFAGLERGAAKAEEALKAAGVTLPDGKTMMDLMTQDGGQGFANFLRDSMNAAVAPIKREIDVAEFTKTVNGVLDVTIREHPDLKPLLPQISEAIRGNEQLGSWAANPQAIPYIMLGVGRDLQWQHASRENAKLKADNDRLKQIIKEAKLTVTAGSSTSKAGGKTPSTAGDGGETVKGLDAIAAAMFDKISTRVRTH